MVGSPNGRLNGKIKHNKFAYLYLASTNTLCPIFPFSRFAQATHTALVCLGTPLDFDPLEEFQLHLEEEYGGIRRDKMQCIRDFRPEK